MLKLICYPLAVLPLSLFLCHILSVSVSKITNSPKEISYTKKAVYAFAINNEKDIYSSYNLANYGLSKEAFNYMMKGYNYLAGKCYLGRSYGCPAVPNEFSKEIIDIIKKGSCLFIYHPEKKYLNSSKILNA